jgi:hypothetical protein
VHRAIAMAEMAGVPVYIVHVSSEDALNQVREARDRGLPAFAETCPQYLLLSLEDVADKGWEGAKYVFTPPLRERKQPAEAVGGPAHGPSASGLDRPLPVLLRRSEGARQGRFHQDSQRRAGHREPAATAASSRRGQGQLLAQPIRRAGFDRAGAHLRHVSEEGRAGRGSDADLVLWDPAAGHTISAKTHHMRVDYSMFEGFQVRGNARDVYSRGELIVRRQVYRQARPRKVSAREARGGRGSAGKQEPSRAPAECRCRGRRRRSARRGAGCRGCRTAAAACCRRSASPRRSAWRGTAATSSLLMKATCVSMGRWNSGLSAARTSWPARRCWAGRSRRSAPACRERRGVEGVRCRAHLLHHQVHAGQVVGLRVIQHWGSP